LWPEVEPTVSVRPDAIEAARLRLANIVLSSARDDPDDAEQLKARVLETYRRAPS